MYKLEECREKGDNKIIIIHGYHGKHTLKTYIQSTGFLKEIKNRGFNLKRKTQSNPGKSIFEII
ncbi:MAG: hypothetical protein JXA99_09495 [Candidatus Lokiarchaeota archaeon]|nr:hypothetical protein [Candidatus Lokiarchaeota archaeon]